MRLIGRHFNKSILRTSGLALALAVVLQFAPGRAASAEVALTDELVQSFIAAQKDLAEISAKLEKESDKPDDAIQAELETAAKKHGFQNFDELDAVSSAVSHVMAGLDPETGEFTNPKEAMQQELAEIKADKEIPAEEKKLLIEELEEDIEAAPAEVSKENIEIVKKLRAEIEAAMQ